MFNWFFFFQKLCQNLLSKKLYLKVKSKTSKDEWVLKIDKTKNIRINGSNFAKFMKTCLELCWKLRNTYKNVKFYWNIKKKPELFKQCGGQFQVGEVARVYIPAVYKDKELRKGKYCFVSNNPVNNTREVNDATGTNTCEKTDKRRTGVRSKGMGSLKDEATATTPTGEGTTEN